MKTCPIHNKPLVRTHGGNDIFLPCFFERMRKRSSVRVTATDPAGNARDKGYKARRKVAK